MLKIGKLYFTKKGVKILAFYLFILGIMVGAKIMSVAITKEFSVTIFLLLFFSFAFLISPPILRKLKKEIKEVK